MHHDANAESPLAGIGSTLWEALSHDTPCQVLVVDRKGTVHEANSVAARHLGLDNSEQLMGRRLSDLYESAFASERLNAVREVLDSGRMAVLQGFSRGSYRRTTFRPLPEDPERVLIVCAPAQPMGTEGYITANGSTVRSAREQDYGPLAGLSDREFEVLRLIAEGYTTAQIAERTNRSAKTIEWHRVSLGNKLGASNRVELARIAVRAGLVDTEAPPESTRQGETRNGDAQDLRGRSHGPMGNAFGHPGR